MRVWDLTLIAGLTALTKLYLAHTQVSDLAPLVGLSKLTKLSLIGTKISDEDPILNQLRDRGVYIEK